MLDAHREESPELIGIEVVEDIGNGRGNVLSKRAGTAAWPRGVLRCAVFSGLNLSLEERVRRKLILAGSLRKACTICNRTPAARVGLHVWNRGLIHSAIPPAFDSKNASSATR